MKLVACSTYVMLMIRDWFVVLNCSIKLNHLTLGLGYFLHFFNLELKITFIRIRTAFQSLLNFPFHSDLLSIRHFISINREDTNGLFTN